MALCHTYSVLQLCRYKNIINRSDRGLKILICYSDNNVQLTRSLIDHLNIYICMGQRRKNPARSSSCGTHSPAYYGDSRKVRFQIDRIRLCNTVNRGKYLLFFAFKFLLMNKYRHGIDTGRHMFK